jgi:integrase/recombinase XerD
MGSIIPVGIYLRPLRAIINQAVSEGLISKENHYAFGKGKYQIPSARNIKKALTLEELGKIYHYTAVYNSWQEKARDFFLFSYLGSGINVKDIALLKFQNIDGDNIRFIRAKTQDTTRTGSKILSIHISADIRRIIDRWKNQQEAPENYLFPILQIDFTPSTIRKVIQQFTKMMNKYLNVISSEVGLNKHITTYFARHSFATVSKRNGTSIAMISESLGHSSQKTTTSYLDSFEDDAKKDMQEKLLNFKIEGSPVPDA